MIYSILHNDCKTKHKYCDQICHQYGCWLIPYMGILQNDCTDDKLYAQSHE